MVPPWVPELTTHSGDDHAADPDAENQDTSQSEQPEKPGESTVPVAPAGRFRPARMSVGRFASGGDGRDLRRAIGHYVHTGLGGTKTATRRLGGTVHTANALHSALSQLASGQSQPVASLDRNLLAGKSAREVVAAVVEAVRPVDGTLDAEASRNAVSLALSDLLTRFPEADLLNLTELERSFVIECFVARDVYNRFHLDVGKTLLDKAPSAAAAAARCKEVLDYVRQTVSAAFRNLATAGQQVAAPRIAQVVQSAISGALRVFEEYVQ